MPAKKSRKTKNKPARADWRRIRLFAMDVDGILTDGSVHVASDGTETKTFHIPDGAGLHYLRWAGVATAWISGRASDATTIRAAELKIPRVIQGKDDKLGELRKIAAQLNLEAAEIVYMGDDIFDAPAIKWAGIGVTVPAALPAALAAADVVTKNHGGRGAVREICDRILAAQGKDPLNFQM